MGERPRPRRRTTRRRRLLTRGVPIVVLAVAAFVLGLIVAGGPGRAERKLVQRLRHCLGPQSTTPRCTGCSTRSLRPRSRSRHSSPHTGTPPTIATLEKLDRPVTSRRRSRGHDRGPGPGADTHLRHAQRDPPGPARRQRRERARAVRGRVAVPRPAPRRDAEPEGRAAAPRRHPGQRRHPAGAGTGALLADLGRRRPRSSARSGRSRHRRRRSMPRRGIRRTPRSARTGSSGSSSIGSPAPRAARCSPGRGRSPTPIRRRARR